MIQRRTPLKRSPIKRKPPKSRTIIRGEREICTGQAWEERRAEVHDRAQGQCERKGCWKAAPLHDQKDEMGVVWRKAGEAHHKRKRGMAGGFRDDRKENLEWLCWGCHAEAHIPKKVVPSKRADAHTL